MTDARNDRERRSHSRMRLVLVSAACLVLAACGQKIVVAECDASHDGATADGSENGDSGVPNGNGNDSGGPNDTGPGSNDTGGNNGDTSVPNDGGNMNHDAGDAGPVDTGVASCATAPYCVHDLTPSMARVNVRQAVTFTPMIDNPMNAMLTFTVDKTEITGQRRMQLPAVNLSDLDVSLVVDANGVVTFTVNEVPTYFATTTFTVRLHAKSATGPDVVGTGSVDVRGNLLFSASSEVYAVASDGRPAHSINFTQGQIISGTSFVTTPRQLMLARDGSLLVYDQGSTPPRIRRFQLSGENVALGDFAYQDSMNNPYIPSDQTSRGLAQLMDGRFVLSVFELGRTGGDSFVLLFKEDGSFDRMHVATDPTVSWISCAANTTANEILVVESLPQGRLVRLDPDTGMELGAIATDIANAHGLMAIAGGGAYVGISGAIIRVSAQGGKTMVSMLPGQSDDYWSYLAPYADGKIVAARDTYSDYANVDVIDGTTSVGWLRAQNVGGVNTLPSGLVYLE
jgi:hypothetical protein